MPPWPALQIPPELLIGMLVRRPYLNTLCHDLPSSFCFWPRSLGSIAGMAADKKPSDKPEATQTARPQDRALEKTMPFTGPVVDPKSYIIDVSEDVDVPEDVLYVRVWREPDLSGPVSVSPGGKISMQLIKSTRSRRPVRPRNN